MQVIIAKTKAIAETIKMLSSNYSSERHASLAFLLELSKSELLLENIGSTAGCILMLITMKYNESTDAFAAEKAAETLKNMEKCPKNIKRMAENGLLEPLLNHLVDGKSRNPLFISKYICRCMNIQIKAQKQNIQLGDKKTKLMSDGKGSHVHQSKVQN